MHNIKASLNMISSKSKFIEYFSPAQCLRTQKSLLRCHLLIAKSLLYKQLF